MGGKLTSRTREERCAHLQLVIEKLESKILLAGDTCLQGISISDGLFASTVEVGSLDATSTSLGEQHQAQPLHAVEAYQSLKLPADLPSSFSVAVDYAGESLTLQLDKNSIFGENTKFFVDGGTGNLERVDHGVDRSYLGTVAEDPRFTVSAWLGEAGLHATIIRPNQPSITVEPLIHSSVVGLHSITVEAEAPANYSNHDHNGDGIPDHAPEDHTDETGGGHPPGCTCAACCGNLGYESEVSALTPSAANGDGGPFSEADPNISATTLPPNRTIEIREYEIGVEIGSAALLNNYSGSTTQQKVDNAMSVAQGIPGNLDARFLRAAGIKHRLGTVIIRTGSDPFNVANGNDSAGLSAFRNYWNNLQANEGIAPTHDLAVYHVRSAPSGLAYVNSVGTSNRYALSASNGPTSWADGTLAHEFGHSWNLGHVPSGTTHSADFYESRPRPNGNAPGAPADQDSRGISIMSGAGSRNIGRLSTGEANRVLSAKQNKLQFGDTVTNEPEVAPFGWVDTAVAMGGTVVIDVVANDHDANNDVLDAQLRDTVSFLGGTISLSQDTGPGGRNEIIYTPPAGTTGEDFFHYTVVDGTGRSDFGAVYVSVDSPPASALTLIVDPSSGQALLQNPSNDAIEIDGYSIESAASLQPTGWNSLEDAGYDNNEWFEASSTSSSLAELNPLESSVIAPGQSLSLGALYNPSAAQDLELEVFLADSLDPPLVGQVVYQALPVGLTVDRVTGQVSLTNSASSSIAIDGYTIRSDAGSLNLTNWLSLDDQGIEGNTWSELPATANQLGELNATTSTLITSSGSLSLGALFNTNSAEDLVFEYFVDGEALPASGPVFYTSLSFDPADFNTDGNVDGSDLTIWQGAYGQNDSGDADNDSDSDGFDFLTWQRNFNATSNIAALTVIEAPAEPSVATSSALKREVVEELFSGPFLQISPSGRPTKLSASSQTSQTPKFPGSEVQPTAFVSGTVDFLFEEIGGAVLEEQDNSAEEIVELHLSLQGGISRRLVPTEF